MSKKSPFNRALRLTLVYVCVGEEGGRESPSSCSLSERITSLNDGISLVCVCVCARARVCVFDVCACILKDYKRGVPVVPKT
jgi:hypothetical protein